MISKKVFIVYPCGKKFEIRVPIIVIDNDGQQTTVLPGQQDYLLHATKKFQINNLKIVEEEVFVPNRQEAATFISLAKKIRSVE